MALRSPEPYARGQWLRRFILAQGAYYALTGLWPIVHFRSFAKAFALPVHPFQAHILGAMLVVIGAVLVEQARKEPPGQIIALLGLSVASAIALVELIWLPQLGTFTWLWIDLGLQLALAVGLLVFYPRAQDEGRPGTRRRNR